MLRKRIKSLPSVRISVKPEHRESTRIGRVILPCPSRRRPPFRRSLREALCAPTSRSMYSTTLSKPRAKACRRPRPCRSIPRSVLNAAKFTYRAARQRRRSLRSSRRAVLSKQMEHLSTSACEALKTTGTWLDTESRISRYGAIGLTPSTHGSYRFP
jgi:hypothetical protein